MPLYKHNYLKVIFYEKLDTMEKVSVATEGEKSKIIDAAAQIFADLFISYLDQVELSKKEDINFPSEKL